MTVASKDFKGLAKKDALALRLLPLCLLLFGVGAAHAGGTPTAAAPTAMDQAQGTKTDVETTRLIRRKLVNDKTLSTSAKNLNVVTLGDTVSIAGTVSNERELVMVRQHISEIAATAEIDDRRVRLAKAK